MGQYYKAALIKEDKIKVITPGGCKLMEHAWIGNRTMRAIEALLKDDPQRVVWVGDYSQCAPFVWSYRGNTEVNLDGAETLNLGRFDDVFIINHDKECYINITIQEFNKDLHDVWDNVVHPLPLLCRAETEDAGGDYHSEINKQYLGTWAGDRIEVKVLKNGIIPDCGYSDMTDILYFKEE